MMYHGANTQQAAANPPPPLPSKSDLIQALQSAIHAGDELANAAMPKRSSWWQRVWYGRLFSADDYDMRMLQLHHYKGRVMKARGILRLCFPPPPPSTGPQEPSTEWCPSVTNQAGHRSLQRGPAGRTAAILQGSYHLR